MDNYINTYSDLIADKLSLREKAVKKFIKKNKYNEDQLKVIYRQIGNNEIYLPILIDAIINNSDYRISIY